VAVTEEGRHGFTLVVRSGAGVGRRPPQAGDPPQVWVEVDETPPWVELYAPEVGRDLRGAKLTLRWKATDQNLAARPIGLEYAERAEGPWIRIAAGLENTGRYVWRLPPDAPARLWLRIRAADRAGNVGVAQTHRPVVVDPAQPEAIILGAEPAAVRDKDRKERPPDDPIEEPHDRGTNAAPGDVHTINHRSFQIPFHVDPGQRARIRELELYSSTDRGRTWVQEATAGADQTSYRFCAPSDGEYWFRVAVVDTQGNRQPDDVAKAGAGIKIRVETKK
jgi:hypothetical protein